MSIEKFISLENQIEDESIPQFKLRSPPKGKIYRGPNWNAFNRENLGSIPGNMENIIIKDLNERKIGFSTNSTRFPDKSDNLSSSLPGPGSYKTTNSFSTSNPSFSSLGYGNGFISKHKRFDDLKEFNDKFLPGPGHFNSLDSTNISSEINKSLNYKGLYRESNIKSLKIKKDEPGPCTYDPKHNLIKSDLTGNYNFYKESERFRKKKTEIIPGPGKYFRPENSEFFIKDQGVLNYFFKKATDKNENLVKKYFKDESDNKFKVPGVGQYNLRKEIGKSYENNLPFLVQKINQHENQKITEEIQSYKTDFYEAKSAFDGKKSVTSVFVSNSPKIPKIENDNPGPAYYKPTLLPNKIGFNFNIEEQWI